MATSSEPSECPCTKDIWGGVPMGPPDSILGLKSEFAEAEEPKAMLGVGAFRDARGKPWVLPTVLEAINRIEAKMATGEYNMEYLPITGDPAFVDLALAFGLKGETAMPGADPLGDGRIAAVQCLSGTGGLRLGAQFIGKFFGHGRPVYLPNVTWPNHNAVMLDAGLRLKTYRYYDARGCCLDFDNMVKDIEAAPKGSIFVLHACAHNPTGVDPSKAQWDAIAQLLKKKNHTVFLDCAYQGFASGDADADAYGMRKVIAEGNRAMLVQSFAKNFGLYCQRIGVFSIVCGSKCEKARVISQLKLVIRAMYSNPPAHGARIIREILSDGALTAQWRVECATMAERIKAMRERLHSKLMELGSKWDWSHITNQIGMFCFTGIRPDMVAVMKKDHRIFLTDNGRISMAGVNEGNLEMIATAMHLVTKDHAQY